MPKIQADFTTVQAGFDNTPLPDGAYLAKVDDIKEGKTSDQKKDMLTFQLVTEGNEDPAHNGKYIFDRITLQKNDGTINPVALSQIKAYGVAILGEEAANNPEGLNTDDFKGARVMVVVGIQTYQRKNADGSPMMQDGAPVTGQSNEVKRILAAG